MFVLIENGKVYGPEPLGHVSVAIGAGKIFSVGSFHSDMFDQMDVDVDHIDASDCVVVPGFIDPHQHLLGGSGEKGFASQTPEVQLSELINTGITTVVGTLGVDTTSRTLPALLAKAKGLNQEGISAYIYSGGYNVPPVCLTGSVRSDMMLISEVIGAGEIAIADVRSTQPSAGEIARVVADAYVGGILTGKAGITNFHVGPGLARLAILREVLDHFDVLPECLYPTHVDRSKDLLKEAVGLTKRGVTVDLDTFDQHLPKWVQFFLEENGDLARLTVSSDAAINSPCTLHEQIVSTVRELNCPLEQLLPLITSNTARVLKLTNKGKLAAGADADVVVLDRATLAIRHVVAQGRTVLRDSRLLKQESSMDQSNRTILLEGRKHRVSQ
jgi:beta-aspartyl-dipeptidase (metallo-type)